MIFCDSFWVCIRGTCAVNHSDYLHFSPTSCTPNSTECCEMCIPASATAPFQLLASQPLDHIPCSIKNNPPQAALLLLRASFQWSEVSMWLSRTLGLVVFHLWSCSRNNHQILLHANSTTYSSTDLKCFLFLMILMLIHHTCLFNLLSWLSLSFSPCLQCILGRIVEQAPG